MVVYFRFINGELRDQAITWMQQEGYTVDETEPTGIFKTIINGPMKISETISTEEIKEVFKAGNITEPRNHEDFIKFMTNKKANRATGGKPMLQLLDMRSVIPGIRALEYGLTKYEYNNWKKGMEKEDLLAVVGCLSRHLDKVRQIIDGERSGDNIFDHDSNVHHVGGVVANALILSYQLTVNQGQKVTTDKPEYE